MVAKGGIEPTRIFSPLLFRPTPQRVWAFDGSQVRRDLLGPRLTQLSYLAVSGLPANADRATKERNLNLHY